MAAQAVEWVLAIYYGPSAHRATYGRLGNTKYTKDYIQLSRKEDFIETISRLFVAGAGGQVPITYKWPTGSTNGSLVFQSADRPHLKWETRLGAPKAWKMTPAPGEATAETIPGDPSHQDFEAAENELALLGDRGAGQPYLIAVKLKGEANSLHLRAYLKGAHDDFSWASIERAPDRVKQLVNETSKSSAIAWSLFESGGIVRDAETERAFARLVDGEPRNAVIESLHAATRRSLAVHLRQPGFGLFFDPTKNHDAWLEAVPLPDQVASEAAEIADALDAWPPVVGTVHTVTENPLSNLPEIESSRAARPAEEAVPNAAATVEGAATSVREIDTDSIAENLESDPIQTKAFRRQIEQRSFAVPDSTATVKTRGSAQKAFAEAVKDNYGYRCAITGIEAKDFLVASHIVPWSVDSNIRLDPSNGICLSLMVDRAFERGYLLIQDDFSIRVDWAKVNNDYSLTQQLRPFDGQRFNPPARGAPKIEYLQRRRSLF